MTAPTAKSRRAIVAGVDGSTDNSSAVAWAVGEAARSQRPLKLVTVTESVIVRTPPFLAEPLEVNHAEYMRSVLDQTADSIRRDNPELDVAAEVRIDEPVQGLVAEADDASMLVVGKRGIGAIKRLTVGST
jgi:nucleotide-binding universal stress UspA family protein